MTFAEAYTALLDAFAGSDWITGKDVAFAESPQSFEDIDELRAAWNEAWADHAWTLILEMPVAARLVDKAKLGVMALELRVTVCENSKRARPEGTPLATMAAVQSLLGIPLNKPDANRLGRNTFNLGETPYRFLGNNNGILCHRLTFSIQVHVAPE